MIVVYSTCTSKRDHKRDFILVSELVCYCLKIDRYLRIGSTLSPFLMKTANHYTFEWLENWLWVFDYIEASMTTNFEYNVICVICSLSVLIQINRQIATHNIKMKSKPKLSPESNSHYSLGDLVKTYANCFRVFNTSFRSNAWNEKLCQFRLK